MPNRDWRDLGNDILDIVQGAIDSKDFHKLNQTIQSAVSQAAGYVGSGVRTADEFLRRSERSDQAANQARRQNEQTLLFIDPVSVRIGGTALAIAGQIFATAAGIALLVLSILILSAGSFHLGFYIAISLLIPSFLGSLWMVVKGRTLLGRVKRFWNYVRRLGGKTYCQIKELSETVRKPPKFVLNDLEYMIHKGWFRQGHLDLQNTCLIVDHKTYEQYLTVLSQPNEIRPQAQAQSQTDFELSSEVQKVIQESNRYIEKIHRCGDVISDAEMMGKITRMEVLTRRILERVRQHPEMVSDIHRLMDYYLPTTVKLLDAYAELNTQPVQGENITGSRQEIEETLDTLNLAYEKLLDSLFRDTAWDVSTDITVLKTMLAQEGLTKTDF